MSRSGRESGLDRRYPPVVDLVPHSGPMVLLTRVLDHTADRTTCLVQVGEGAFLRGYDGRVPAWVGLEYMAQCIAAHAGLRARANGEAVQIGFLLGSRRVEMHTAGFACGQVLEVTVRRQWGDRQLGSFACSLVDAANGELLLQGDLTVLLARDVEALAQGLAP